MLYERRESFIKKAKKASKARALDMSIAHWKRHKEGKAESGEGIYSDDCALCVKYINDTEGYRDAYCEKCPVKERTGYSLCRGTPWHLAAASFEQCSLSEDQSEEFRKAAAEMHSFLISLKEVR